MNSKSSSSGGGGDEQSHDSRTKSGGNRRQSVSASSSSGGSNHGKEGRRAVSRLICWPITLNINWNLELQTIAVSNYRQIFF